MMNIYCYFITLLLFCSSLSLYSQNIIPVSAIPDSLKENANAVFILDEGYFEIVNDEKAIFKVTQIIAILNAKGNKYATESLWYDEHRKIESFGGNVYDATGKPLKKFLKTKIEDYSSSDGFSIYSDNRIQYADFKQNTYPYIVEFQYEIAYKYTYSIPDWYILPGQNVSVMKSKYTIKSSVDYKPRTKILNTDVVFSQSVNSGIVSMNIEFSNIKAVKREPYGPDFNEIVPVIKCAPSKFNYEGYEGDMSTWKGFGEWQLALNKGRDIISEETQIKINEITKDLTNKEEKIRAIYEYVQNKTRYVSIQLGIGGFQPFPASDVDELGYGDCKALTNYTYSLLKSQGIESNYTLVYGGKNPVELDRNFPDDTFNHIILCVPNEQDTVWLECTNQTNPFGYLGDFTSDRDVLVVNEDGGKIAHTTIYKKGNNIQKSLTNVIIDESGHANASIKIIYTGLQTENNKLNFVLSKVEKEKKQWVYANTGISDFTLQNFSFEIEKKKIPVITEKLEIVINNFTSNKGDRLFFIPNLINRWNFNPKKNKNRQTDIIRKFTGIDIDTITYTIPSNFYVEYLPESINFESDFGIYSSSVSYKDGKLQYIRKLELNKGRFPKESYEEFRNFNRKIIKADRSKVVFVNKT